MKLRLIPRLLVCYTVGSIFLAIWAVYGTMASGALYPNYLMIVLWSPIQAIFINYDVLVLGKMKLLGGFTTFYSGAILAGIYLFFKARKIR